MFKNFTSGPTMVLVAHGTRSEHGVAMIHELAQAVSAHVADVRVAFVDVLGPSPSQVLSELDAPAVLVPAFLASGYHVHTDLPREIAEFENVTVTPALGPDQAIAAVQYERLVAAGWRRGDAVILSAAGSSDARAMRDIDIAASMLAELVQVPVSVAYAATGSPWPKDSVAGHGGRRVFVASYLLADGLFQQRLSDSGATGVGEPLGAHPRIVELLVARYRAGLRALAHAA